jgi:hypothetical protein
MNLVQRAKNIILNPAEEWPVIEAEQADMAGLYKGYIIPLAAIAPVCSLIGMWLVGIRIPIVGTVFHVSFGHALVYSVISYLLALAGVFVVSLIVNGVAPYFMGVPDRIQSLKVVAYASTPGWVAGVLQLVPMLGLATLLLSLYGLYLLYKGLPVLMKSPPEKALGYTAVVVVGAIIVFLVIGSITHSFIRLPTPDLHMTPSQLPSELTQ